MRTSVLRVQGAFELSSLSLFVYGYLADSSRLLIVGGCLVVLDDLIEILLGVLNPLFPVLAASIAAFLFTPWYVGVFWASAIFKVLNIPGSLMKLFAPSRFVAKAMRSRSTSNQD